MLASLFGQYTIGLPLLRKDLIELSARRSTYVLRLLYAILLYIIFWFAFERYVGINTASMDALSIMGRGSKLFDILFGIQLASILVFLPGMVSGAIAIEREKQTLQLLLITGLRPWEIVMQKLGSRLVPMFSLLFLSLPLMALSYSLGGISAERLLAGILALLFTCLQAGSIAIYFSARCNSVASAFICSYVFGGLFYLFVPWCFPPYIFRQPRLANLLSGGIFVVIPVFFCLIRACGWVSRHATGRNFGNWMLSVHQYLDYFFERFNHLVGSVVLIDDRESLPEDRPVRWRELRRRALGKTSHLLRTLLYTEAPLLLIAVFLIGMGGSRSGDLAIATVLIALVWIVAVLLISVSGSGLVSAERSQQTLDVLLSAPLEGSEILREKIHGLRRLLFVIAVPLVSLHLMEYYWEYSTSSYHGISGWVYCLSSALSIVIYLPLLSWISLWLGAKARSRSRGIMLTLFLLLLWLFLPIIAAVVFDRHVSRKFMLLASPVGMVAFTELDESLGKSLPWAMAFHYTFYGCVLSLLRWHCLSNADALLGRVRPEKSAQRFTAPR